MTEGTFVQIHRRDLGRSETAFGNQKRFLTEDTEDKPSPQRRNVSSFSTAY